MHPVACHALMGLLIAVGLSGCMDEGAYDWGGIGLRVHKNYEGDPFYYYLFSNEAPDQKGILGGMCPGIPPGDQATACAQAGTACATPEKPRDPHGNWLRDGLYIKFDLHEAKNVHARTNHMEGQPGELISSHRWNVECTRGYSIVVESFHKVDLYLCDFCREPEDWEDLEPLPYAE